MNFREGHLGNIEVVAKEEAIVNHEITPKNRNENQIRLACEVYKYLTGVTGDFLEDANLRNEIMGYWTDSTDGKNLSALYRQLEESDEFKNHPRLKGNIFKITPQDILHYRENGTLPE